MAGQFNIHEPQRESRKTALTPISSQLFPSESDLIGSNSSLSRSPTGRGASGRKYFFPHESPRCFSLLFSTRWPSPGYNGAYLNNCLSESGVAAPTDPMHTNELPSDSSTGRDHHAAAENATFMSSEKHEKRSGLLSRKISAGPAGFSVAADDSENWKPSVKIFRLFEESL